MTEYGLMKDSGIEWLGRIPKEWSIFPAGGVFSEVKEKNTDNRYDNPFSFRYGEIVDKEIHGNIDKELKETLSNYTVVYPNTIVLNGLNLNYDFISQRVAIVNNTGIITSAYLAVKPNEQRVFPKFVLYLLKAYDYKQVFHGIGSGVRKTLKFTDFKSVKIVAPEIEQQKSISLYLDSVCTNIATAIAEAKASIEDYKLLKQSIITKAVTKGLNPNVPMKDSGIEWIGEIPNHWEIRRIKSLGSARNGLTYSPDDLCNESEGTLVLRSSNIQNGKIVLADNVYVKCPIQDTLMVKDGDILICSRNGSRKLIGKNALISGVKATFGAFMMIYRCIAPKYIYYILNSSVFSYYLGSFFTSTINQLTAANFNNMKIVYCPDENEQSMIVNYLDKVNSEIDSLITEKEAMITDLEAYKKSLIFEVVTGKRKVC